ncbi:hypothetical protein DENSPDRAFT_835974 [Dentipellis sp. KUC8613]|nr:hypothetical protein DENSPDRAFT_835974 [Dentipellis sp. KUC8613]
MEDPKSSPSRSKKVTYGGRAKRKRESVNYAEDESAEEGDQGSAKGENASMPPPPSPRSNKKPRSTRKGEQDTAYTPEQVTPSKPPSKVNKRPSISSLADVKAPLSPMKPPSVVTKKVYINRFQTPDVDLDDAVSVAESSKGARRTEADRKQFFLDHPQCREVEPHRAFCTGCNEWVPLNPTKPYTMRPWTVHQKACKKKTSPAKPLSASTTSKSPENDDEAQSEDDETSSIAQSVSDKSKRKTEVERQAYLESDPRSEEVRPYEALCKTCQKWIKLGAKQRYSIGNWRTHQKRCSGSVPSSRVATAERKLKLVNDSSAKSFTVKSVECRACGAMVALEGEEDYNLTKWEEHKTSCQSPPASASAAGETAAKPAGSSEDSPRRSEKAAERPPPSVASTEATAVASDASAPLNSGRKRSREDEEEAEGDEPPRQRARTEAYKPSGAMGWLLAPFKSFIDGFKEGLNSSTPSQ